MASGVCLLCALALSFVTCAALVLGARPWTLIFSQDEAVVAVGVMASPYLALSLVGDRCAPHNGGAAAPKQ